MFPLFLFASVSFGLLYIGYVIFWVIRSNKKGGILNVLTAGTLLKMACAFLTLCIASGAVFMGGTAGAISGSGGSAEGREMLETMLSISESCLYATLALAAAALIRRFLK